MGILGRSARRRVIPAPSAEVRPRAGHRQVVTDLRVVLDAEGALEAAAGLVGVTRLEQDDPEVGPGAGQPDV